MKKLLVITILATLLIAASNDVKQIFATGPIQCDPGQIEEHWVWSITDINAEDSAPDSIFVTWNDGGESVGLSSYTPVGTAKYKTNSHDGEANKYLEAYAFIYGEWNGSFHLSHPPCPGDITSTPVLTVVILDTPTSTAITILDTPTPEVDPTVTDTGIPVSSVTATPTDDLHTIPPPKITTTVTPTLQTTTGLWTPIPTLPPPSTNRTVVPVMLPITGGSNLNNEQWGFIYGAAFLLGLGIFLFGIALRSRSR